MIETATIWPNAQTASARVSVRLGPAEKRALIKTARLLKWSQSKAVQLAICHLSETMRHGEPVYVSLPPHKRDVTPLAREAAQ